MANKLELTWVGKEDEIRIEPRILVENPTLSNLGKVKSKVGQASIFDKPISDNFDNMLIHGDNLLALKALEANYAGKIKCIYIDPPYNTGSAFEHYDDNIEHSTWLSLMKPRLELLRTLLSDDGSIWISIDADESHYLKVLCDEVFGRRNFIDEIVWQRAFSPINLKKTLSRAHDIILVYAKNKTPDFCFNLLARNDAVNSRYKNPDNDVRGPWTSGDLSVGPRVEANVYPITTPSGRIVLPPEGYSWRLNEERFKEYVADNRIWFGPDGNNTPRIKRFLSDVKQGVVAMTWWTREEIGDNQEAKREIKAFKLDTVFDTPKPERLIHRILTIATNPNDIVLDSFLGSGTTCAVAHKMGRKWIGIEMMDTAYTYCKKRMDFVLDGEQGGISKIANWNGGGGYRFYELAPSLVVEDKFGNPVINKSYNAEMLSAAMALHEGFTYQPDSNFYWKQGKNENAYIFTTTTHITADYLASIAAEMQENEYLVICCKTYDAGIERMYKNISIKKIPQVLLGRCEFGRDDYSLNIIDVPTMEDDDE